MIICSGRFPFILFVIRDPLLDTIQQRCWNQGGGGGEIFGPPRFTDFARKSLLRMHIRLLKTRLVNILSIFLTKGGFKSEDTGEF